MASRLNSSSISATASTRHYIQITSHHTKTHAHTQTHTHTYTLQLGQSQDLIESHKSVESTDNLCPGIYYILGFCSLLLPTDILLPVATTISRGQPSGLDLQLFSVTELPDEAKT